MAGHGWVKSLQEVFADSVLNRLSVCFDDICFAFIYDRECPTETDACASTLELFIRELEFHSNGETEQNLINCDCHLNGFSVTVRRRGGDFSRILHQWCWQSHIVWKRGSEESRPESVSVKTQANALLLSLSDATIVTLMEMAMGVVEYTAVMRHRCHRPQKPVADDPIRWWKHAGRSVVHEIDRVCSLRRVIKCMDYRRTYRQQYEQLYQNYRRLKRWSWIWALFLGTERSALQAMRLFEKRLSTLEVAEFRWWTWVLSKKRKREPLSLDHMQRKLLEIYNLLSIDTGVQEIETVWNFDVIVSCPKISILLELDRFSALLICLQGIEFDLSSGAAGDAKYQTAAGVFSIGMSCFSLEVGSADPGDQGLIFVVQVSHERSGKKHPHGVSGRRRDSAREEDEAWIARSPPRLQDRRRFLDVKYVKPALADVSHRDLKISVAPIDLSYVETCILKIATFMTRLVTQLTCGTSGEQEPSLSLRIEEVTGEADSNFKRVAPVQQLALEAAVGDVRIISPCRRDIPKKLHGARGARVLRRLNRIRRSTELAYRLTTDQPLLVLVFSGFSMKTRIDEWEEAIQDTITLADSLTAREQMLTSDSIRDASPEDTQSPRFGSRSILSTDDLTEELETTVHETQRRFTRKLSVQFTFRAFLGDPRAPGEMTFHQTVQLITPVTIESICNSHIGGSSLTGLQHIIKVQLHMSELHCYVSPLTLFELSQVVDSLTEVQGVMKELYAALLKPAEETIGASDGRRSAVPSTEISTSFDLSTRVPVLTVTFCHAFSFADDVENTDLHLGHVMLHMLEVMMVSDECKTEVDFVIRRMEVVLDHVLSSTAMHDSTADRLSLPFTVLKPMPTALIPTLMTDRKLKLRAFQEWRKSAKGKSHGRSGSSGVHSFMETGLSNQLQFAGRVFVTRNLMSISMTSTFLVLALDNQAVDACVAYGQEVTKFFLQLEREMQEIKKYWPVRQETPVANIYLGSSLQQIGTVQVDPEPRTIKLDFGLGCLRLCASVNGRQLSTVSASNLRGTLEHRQNFAPQLAVSIKIEDIILINHMTRCSRYKTVADGNVDERDDVLDENCQISLHYETNTVDLPVCGDGGRRRSMDSTNVSILEREMPPATATERRSVLRVTISRMRMALIARFIKDWNYFLNLSIRQYFEAASTDTHGHGVPSVAVHIDFHDYRLLIPRTPSSEEFYAIFGKRAQIAFPASVQLIERMKEAMFTRECDTSSHFDDFWQDLLCVTADDRAGKAGVDENPCPVDHDHLGSQCFGHEDVERTLIHTERSCIEWGFRLDDGQTLRRRVLDSGDILLVMKGIELEVYCPSVKCIMGDVQFSLLMDCIESNYNERCSFEKEPEVEVAVGDVYPKAGSPPESLGILNSEAPSMNVHVHIGVCAFLMETRLLQSESAESLGMGQPLAEVLFESADVWYTMFDTGSSRLRVMAHGVAVHDIRQTLTDGSCLTVLSIDPRRSGDGSHLIQISSRVDSRWGKVWETFQPGRTTSTSIPLEIPEATDASGFIFDFVQQQREPDVETGPLVMEVILLDAQLMWPYFHDTTFVDSLNDAFNAYYSRPTCSIYREDPGPDEWVYINCIFKNSKLTLPIFPRLIRRKHLPMRFTASANEMDGFRFGWESARVGYYWGGDGETKVLLDFRSFSADWVEGSSRRPKTCIAPFTADISLRQQCPKHSKTKEQVNIKIVFSEICFMIHLNRINLIRKCMNKLQSIMDEEGEGSEAESRVLTRGRLVECRIQGSAVTVQLMDERQPPTIAGASINRCRLQYRSDQRILSASPQCSAEFSGALEVVYMNDALDSMDPFIEGWEFSCECLDNGLRKSVTVTSPNRMNILATPAVIPPLAETLSFVKRCTSAVSIARLSSRNTAISFDKRAVETGKYKLVNKSGVPLNYWVESENGLTHPEKYQVMPEEEEFLKVAPVSKPVLLPHANTKIQTKTICLLFAGNWNELENIVVDKVGKYVYELKSPHTHLHVHVIVDVTVDHHTKVITAHSVYRVVNRTDRKMRFLAHFFSDDEGDAETGDDQKGRVVRRQIPGSGYTSPDEETFLPLIPCARIMLYFKVSHYNKSHNVDIKIDSPKQLLQLQGMYVCTPSNNGPVGFHCCLEAQEAKIKAQDSTVSGSRAEVTEYTFLFHPALTVQNLLPFPVNVELAAVEGNLVHPYELPPVGQGESLPVYDFSLARSLKFRASFEGGFQTTTPIDLKPSRKTRRVPIDGERTVHFTHCATSSVHGEHLHSLDLQLKESYIAMSGARKLTLYSPFWVANRTGCEIRIKNRKSNFGGRVVANPYDEDNLSSPVLFSSTKAMAYISVSDFSWSKGINLNSVGLKDAVTVMAPAEEDASEDAAVVRPHGVAAITGPVLKSFTQMFSPHSMIESRPVLSSITADDDDSDEEDSLSETRPTGPRCTRHDFAVSVQIGPGDFDVVKVLKISPRYILYNNSRDQLLVGQKGTTKAISLAPDETIDYYWHDADQPQEICVKPSLGRWHYSGGFQLNQVNDFGLRIRHSRSPGSDRILQVDVSLKADSMVCAFCKVDDYPPYRIENRTTAVKIQFRQKGAVRLPWDTVRPLGLKDYAWDYPLLAHRLKIKVISAETDDEDETIREYSLDAIKTYPSFIVRSRPLPARMSRLDMTERLGRELGIRNEGNWVGKVFVRVLAEGPTRIIRFSDVDESQYDATNEQAFEILGVKREQLATDISSVRNKLKMFESIHGIDMEVMYNTQSVGLANERGDLLPLSVSEEPRLVTAPSFEASTSRNTLRTRQGLIDNYGHPPETETPPSTPFYRRPFFINAIKTLSCGMITPRMPAAVITIPPTVQFTEGPKSSQTPRLIGGVPSPFEEAVHAQTPEITDATSSESPESSPFSSRNQNQNSPVPPRTRTMSEKLEEWDDPSLSQLTHRLIRRQAQGGGVLVQETEFEESLTTGHQQMLGGELIVKVHGAKDLGRKTTLRRMSNDSATTALSPAIAKFQSVGRFGVFQTEGDVYCVLKCGGKEDRTHTTRMAPRLKWEKIISFPAVAVDSYLTVTVRSKRLLMDTILGETFIPLAEINERAQIDTTKSKLYALSRPNNATQSSGLIELSIGWRSTPLDRLTLHVRDLQQELDDLEELLAMMTAKENPEQVLALLTQDHRVRSDSWILRSPVGKLEVKVMEARNLAIPVEKLRSGGIYATITCDRDTGKGVTYTTSPSHARLSPVWKENFKYDNVNLNASLSIQLFDIRRIRSDTFLGQRLIDMQALKDGKPHYCWLPLEGSPDSRGKKVSGDVHVRLRWVPNTYGSVDASLDSGLSVNMTLNGFGISLIEASATKLPRELMHVLLDDVSLQYEQRGPTESVQFSLRSMQIDNQLITSLHPVVFAHSRAAAERKRDFLDDENARNETKAVLEIRLEKLNSNPKLLHIRYFTFLLQEIDLVLEEDFLDLILQWFEHLPLEKLKFLDDPLLERTLRENEIDKFIVKILKRRDVSEHFTQSHTTGLRCYLEVLHIQPIKVNITLLSSPAFAENHHSKKYRTALAMGINLLDLTNVPFKINAMVMNNAFMRPREVVAEVMRHVKWQAAYSLHKIFGTVEIIGTPVQLSSSIVTGVASFFYEPAKGIVHGPEEFARGVATGTIHLIKNSMYGVFNTVGNVTEGMGKTLAKLSFDDDYYMRFQNKPRTTKETLVEGTRLLSWSLVQGVTGIITDPTTGATEDGVRGCMIGIGTGIAGVITKPVSGILHFAGSISSGIGENIMEIGDKMDREQRVRVCPPRDFGISVGADVAEAQLQLWKKTLTEIDPDSYADVTVTNFVRQDKQVLIITEKHLIFVNFVKKKLLWVLDLQSVSVSEHRMGRIVGAARKRIICRTRETQHQLLDKIDHAIKTYRRRVKKSSQTIPEEVSPLRSQTLRIMDKAPPSALGIREIRSVEESTSHGDMAEVTSEKETAMHPAAGPSDLAESGSGPLSPIQTLYSLSHLSVDAVHHLKFETLQRTLVHIHEAALSSIIHLAEDVPSKQILELVRDLTRSSILLEITLQPSLVSVYTTVQTLTSSLKP